MAWKDGHVLPRAGGYLDQPRWWRTVIRFMNIRHAPIYAAYMREKFPDKAQNGGEYEGDMPMREGWDALNNWG